MESNLCIAFNLMGNLEICCFFFFLFISNDFAAGELAFTVSRRRYYRLANVIQLLPFIEPAST